MVSLHPELLLETIRSRVQRFDVKPIAQEDIIDALEKRRGLSEEDATRTARIAGGNWLKAIMLLEPGNEEMLFFDLYVMLMRLAYARKVSDLKKWADQCATLGREKQIRMLEAFQRLTREYFMYNFQQPELTYMTEAEEQFARKFAPFINENNIIGMYELFQRAIRDIGQNANPKIQFFDLTMKMAVFIHSVKK
jgi:DNA polymerase-3 subunit delta'